MGKLKSYMTKKIKFLLYIDDKKVKSKSKDKIIIKDKTTTKAKEPDNDLNSNIMLELSKLTELINLSVTNNNKLINSNEDLIKVFLLSQQSDKGNNDIFIDYISHRNDNNCDDMRAIYLNTHKCNPCRNNEHCD